MEPIRFADAPSLDLGVEKRLRRLDKGLVLTWSRFALDPDTGRPIERSGRIDPDPDIDIALGRKGALTEDPGWYLWRKDPASSHHFFVTAYKSFGYPELLRLESDLARFMSPEQITRTLRDNAKRREERGRAAMKERQIDKIKANRRRIEHLVQDNKLSQRDAKVSSYGGQAARTSSAERAQIEMDPKEAGWELPDAGEN